METQSNPTIKQAQNIMPKFISWRVQTTINKATFQQKYEIAIRVAIQDKSLMIQDLNIKGIHKDWDRNLSDKEG